MTVKRSLVALGLGSNVGDSQNQLKRAALALPLSDKRYSWIYQSEALLPKGAPPAWNLPFLNLVAVGETDLEPLELLKEIKNIEVKLGRQDRGRWAPREIDIDILCIGSLVFQSEGLNIPHVDLLSRPFVLLPLAEVWPDWIYPLDSPFKGMNVSDLAAKWRSPQSTKVPFGTKPWEPLL